MIGKYAQELNEWSHINNYSDPNNQHKGYIQIWAGNPNPNKLVKAYTLEEWAHVTIDTNTRAINGPQGTVKLHSNLNYYYTANPMKTASNKFTDNLRGLSRIVIDIDNDSQLDTYKADKNRLLERMFIDLVERNEIPCPTEVVFSGRGVQIHFEIEQNSLKLAFLHELVTQDIMNVIKEWLNKHDDLIMYEVDESASKKHAGLFRLAGINQKSGHNVERYNIGNKYTINDLMSIMGTSKVRKEHKKKESQRTPNNANLSHKTVNLLRGRLKRLNQVQAIKIAHNSYIGTRNNLNFLFINTILPIDADNAIDKLEAFNNNFPNPIPKAELRGMIKSAQENGHYNFTNETFISYMKLKDNQMQALKLDNNPKRTKQSKLKEATNFRIESRIKSLLNDPTLTYTEIAKLLDKSVPTIKRYAKQYNIKRQYQASK